MPRHPPHVPTVCLLCAHRVPTVCPPRAHHVLHTLARPCTHTTLHWDALCQKPAPAPVRDTATPPMPAKPKLIPTRVLPATPPCHSNEGAARHPSMSFQRGCCPPPLHGTHVFHTPSHGTHVFHTPPIEYMSSSCLLSAELGSSLVPSWELPVVQLLPMMMVRCMHPMCRHQGAGARGLEE